MMTIKELLDEIYDKAITNEKDFTFGGIVCHTLLTLENHGFLDMSRIQGSKGIINNDN